MGTGPPRNRAANRDTSTGSPRRSSRPHRPAGLGANFSSHLEARLPGLPQSSSCAALVAICPRRCLALSSFSFFPPAALQAETIILVSVTRGARFTSPHVHRSGRTPFGEPLRCWYKPNVAFRRPSSPRLFFNDRLTLSHPPRWRSPCGCRAHAGELLRQRFPAGCLILRISSSRPVVLRISQDPVQADRHHRRLLADRWMAFVASAPSSSSCRWSARTTISRDPQAGWHGWAPSPMAPSSSPSSVYGCWYPLRRGNMR